MTNSRPKIIGVLKLNTRFPRLHGDIGNPESFDHPVIYQTITTATPATIITEDQIHREIRADILKAAQRLQNDGASLITTSCGFLSAMQQELSEALNVPVITSSLILLPLIHTCSGNGKTGVITFNAEMLRAEHLGLQNQVAIEGLRGHDSLRITIEDDLETLDAQSAESEVCDACIRLLQQSPGIRNIVLECTNLSPYKHTLRQRFGYPVFDVVDAIHWMLQSQ